MEHVPAVQFKSSNKAGALKMLDAIDHAKGAFSTMTSLTVDAVSSCTRDTEGGWIVSLDAVESAARMGDNDLLVTYEVCISDAGELLKFRRTRRYHREDQDQS